MNPCVINFACGGCYVQGQSRLMASLRDTGWTGGSRAYTSTSALGCPPHAEAPYAFKPAAFNHAARDGYDVVLWCDASVWANRSIVPVMERIERDGHLFFQNGWDCCQWTNDACLRNMGVTRDESKSMPMLIAGCLGLDMRQPKAKEFLRQWTIRSLDGSFNGSWNNRSGSESDDPRCLGHRHDQSVASILAHQIGMEQIVGHPDYFMCYRGESNNGRFKYGEQNDMSKVNPEVCLLAQGF